MPDTKQKTEMSAGAALAIFLVVAALALSNGGSPKPGGHHGSGGGHHKPPPVYLQDDPCRGKEPHHLAFPPWLAQDHYHAFRRFYVRLTCGEFRKIADEFRGSDNAPTSHDVISCIGHAAGRGIRREAGSINTLTWHWSGAAVAGTFIRIVTNAGGYIVSTTIEGGTFAECAAAA